MKRLGSVLLGFFFSLSLAHGAKGPTSPPPRPGEAISSGGGAQIFLEGGRILWWSPDGVLKITEPGGASSVQVDLKSKRKTTGGSEAMGLDVEESDLGGRMGDKRYLKGKKDPTGRALDPKALSGEVDEAGKGQSQTQTVAGVKMTETKFPNGAYQLQFVWDQNQETVFFDRRNTLMWMEREEKAGPLKYKARFWGDGSYTRTYRGKGGEFSYNFDSLSKSYRLAFSNAKGEILAEADCDTSCKLD